MITHRSVGVGHSFNESQRNKTTFQTDRNQMDSSRVTKIGNISIQCHTFMLYSYPVVTILRIQSGDGLQFRSGTARIVEAYQTCLDALIWHVALVTVAQKKTVAKFVNIKQLLHTVAQSSRIWGVTHTYTHTLFEVVQGWPPLHPVCFYLPPIRVITSHY